MIATITVIAEIAEKKKFRDHMETTLQRSQRQRSLRDKTFYISAIVVAAIAGEEFPKIAAIAEVFFFSAIAAITAIVAIIWHILNVRIAYSETSI